MERQEIPIRFADLRRLAETVPAYLAQKVGCVTPPLQAGVEDEFGIMGLDVDSLILEFAATYAVDISAFNFTGLISPEVPDWSDMLWFFPMAAYFLVGWLLKTIAGLLC